MIINKRHWLYGFWLSVGLALLFGCSGNATRSKAESSIKFNQYYLQGEALYITHCSNCHQKNGSGLGRIFPPLNKSDFMENNFEGVICLIKNGKSGELVVNGKSFNKTMPAIPSLTNLEIAEIATYIYNTWEHQQGIIDVKTVDNVLPKCDASLYK